MEAQNALGKLLGKACRKIKDEDNLTQCLQFIAYLRPPAAVIEQLKAAKTVCQDIFKCV
jgi:hypothetical protein